MNNLSTHLYIDSIIPQNHYTYLNDSDHENKIFSYYYAHIIYPDGMPRNIGGCSFLYSNMSHYIVLESSDYSQFHITNYSNQIISVFPLDISLLPPNFSIIDLYYHLIPYISKIEVFQ